MVAALSRRPNYNLPRQLTSFIGREAAIATIAGLLQAAPLVTLVGVGGTGKTRLALAVADAVLPAYPDGVYFVSLADVSAPHLVAATIAQTFAIPEMPQRTSLEALTDHLRGKTLLLILDNFEQIVPAAPQLTALLAACPHLTILVTSRSVLHLSSEQVFPVPPLALPDRYAVLTLPQIRRCESVQLFVARATAARSDFILTDAYLPVVAELCHRLEGLPLGIELAAVRLRALPLPDILARLEHRLPFLTGGGRDLPARQQTLRNTIAWSYDLLDDDEQALFRHLAVFHGGTLEAIEAVCNAPPAQPDVSTTEAQTQSLDALNDVTSLVEKSLLRQEELGDGQAWYTMLEIVREYALERLLESGEADAIRRRLVRYYLTLTEEAESELLGSRQTVWFAHLEREQDNTRAVLQWCRERGYAEPAFRIAVALWWFWGVHGHVSEGRAILADLLARFPLHDAADRHLALRAQALRAAGMLASIQGDHAAARMLHEEGLDLRRRLGDPVGIYNALEGLGMITGAQGDIAAARGILEDALSIARTLDEPQYTAAALHNLGTVMHTQGDCITARAILEDCVALRRTLSDPECLAAALLSLAGVTHDLADDTLARQLTQESVALYRTASNRRKEALALANLGDIALSQGDWQAARDALCESLSMQREIGDLAGIAFVLERFVGLASAQAASVQAVRLAAAAAALRESIGIPLSPEARISLDDMLQVARQALGASATDAAWQSGSALSLDAAIAQSIALAMPASAAPAARSMLLTRRERGVAALIAEGLSNRQIATDLFITEGTVANHVVHILDKLGYNSRAQIAVWATRQDLVSSDAS